MTATRLTLGLLLFTVCLGIFLMFAPTALSPFGKRFQSQREFARLRHSQALLRGARSTLHHPDMPAQELSQALEGIDRAEQEVTRLLSSPK